jgi:dolichol-phosphate mannosyltransferase
VIDRYVIVVPTYNEHDNLGRVVDALSAVRPLTPFQGDVLIVDDASPDGTGRLADGFARTHPWVHVLHRPAKHGLGRAYVDGFRWALEHGYSHILEMDADMSHPPSAVPRLLAAAVDADLVLGSRYVPGGGVVGWPEHRRLISRAGSLYARTLLGVPIRDLTGGFKCFHRRVLETINLDAVHGQGYVFQIELTYRTLRMGGRVVEVPITFEDRTAGSSKMTLGIVAEAVWKVPALRVRARGEHLDGRLRPGGVASLVASRPPL